MKKWLKKYKKIQNEHFCRVRYGSKKPFEKDWTNKTYNYDQILKYIPQENYGILTGINELAVLDDDSPDKKLIRLFEESFKETFRVRDHHYFRLKGWDGKKIIFEEKNGRHLGELQGKGQQVIGPGSVHPSGEIYEIKNDCELINIDYNEFITVFKEYISNHKSRGIVKVWKPSNWEGDDIKNISITDIFSPVGLKDMGKGCYQGCHPIHGSVTGMNFRIDTFSNEWVCFRHETGGGIWTAIAVEEGIIDCSCCKKYRLSELERKEVVKTAIAKYGLKPPEEDEDKKDKYKSKWANLINIKHLAEKRKMLNCYKCGKPFDFDEKRGLYSCKQCQLKGGLRKFIRLYVENGSDYI